MKQTIRLKESELKQMIAESVRRVLNEEDNYSYNGEDYRNSIYAEYADDIERENNYKENIKRFQLAYKNVSKEYTIINTLKRRPSTRYEAQLAFSMRSFLKFVKEFEGNSLYERIWEKYGGEYGEIADQYLQKCVFKLKNGNI